MFRRWVPRRSVSVHTVIRVQRLCPLAADDDLPAPSCIGDASLKTNCLTLGRLVCYKVVWSSPGALAPSMVSRHADAAASLTPQATRRRGGRKGALELLSPDLGVYGGPLSLLRDVRDSSERARFQFAIGTIDKY